MIEFLSRLFYWAVTAASGPDRGYGDEDRAPGRVRRACGCRGVVVFAGGGRRTGGAQGEACAVGAGDSDRSSMGLDAAGEFFCGPGTRDVPEMVSRCRRRRRPALRASPVAWMFAGKNRVRERRGQSGADIFLLLLSGRKSVNLEMPIQDDLL